VANAFAMLRLLGMSDRDKDVEILALRHQITVLERRLGRDRLRFGPSDRALAALLHRLPRDVVPASAWLTDISAYGDRRDRPAGLTRRHRSEMYWEGPVRTRAP
jgi:hypothetical protein